MAVAVGVPGITPATRMKVQPLREKCMLHAIAVLNGGVAVDGRALEAVYAANEVS